MISFLKKVKERDPSVKSCLEVALCFPGVHAVFLHRISHFLYKIQIPIVPRFLSNINRILTNVDIHPGALVGKNLFIDHGVGVIIGETAIIGDNVTIYQGVTLGGRTSDNVKRHPTIGNNVTIGCGAKIIGNIKIGDNARIGPNSVIIEDVKENVAMVAESAKVLRKKDQGIEYYI